MPLENYRKAFTLVEILITLTITSIIVLALHGTYGQGNLLWNRSEEDAKTYRQIKTLTETIRSETASIYLETPSQNDDSGESENSNEYNFILNGNTLSFFTLNSSYKTSDRYSKISKILYTIELNDDTDLKTIKRLELLAAGGKTIETLSNNDQTEILNSGLFSELRFEAYVVDPQTQNGSWKKDYTSNNILPKAIALFINKPETKHTQAYETKWIIYIESDATNQDQN